MAHRLMQVLIALYLVECLAVWPLLVVLFRLLTPTWREANRQAWERWNEIRLNPYAL
jgi:hypothetical protein